jgi:hypothetical protein
MVFCADKKSKMATTIAQILTESYGKIKRKFVVGGHLEFLIYTNKHTSSAVAFMLSML